ncbi:MAG: DASS family sodium-coupled anion symporter [Sphingobacteriales bacterium]|nr:DASS family sodium-coupled anion symporter [Sphingobacteriales bacterium]
MNRMKILTGPLLFFIAILYAVLANAPIPVCAVIGTALWMIYWWITETVSMAVTALLPMILFPIFGVMDAKAVAPAYGNSVVYLFMGGFILALALEKWNLHKRIALFIIQKTGSTAKGLLLGILLSTGFISMWISNTATAVMMLPIATSLLAVLESHHEKQVHDNLTKSLLLGIAYASNIGGMATLIGTPPNVVFAAYMSEHHHQTIGFGRWMLMATPLSLLLLLFVWYLMAYVLFPLGKQRYNSLQQNISQQLNTLGNIKGGERKVLIVFTATCLSWISREYVLKIFPGLIISDTTIALASAIALFLLSADDDKRILDWKDTQKLPWGILLLFGGGLCLADGLEKQGLIQLISQLFDGLGGNLFLTILILATLSVVMTEFLSNVAQVTILLPVMTGIAKGFGLPPYYLIIPMTLAASCGFMLPMGTPPNAIVFSTGELKIKDMMRTGIWINIASIIVITVFCYLLMPVLFSNN